MNQRDFIASWENIHTIIDEAMEKHDRTVSIYISSDGTMSVNIFPWPNIEDLYHMYKKGKITFTDFRAKAGLPMIKEEDFLLSKTRFCIQQSDKEEKIDHLVDITCSWDVEELCGERIYEIGPGFTREDLTPYELHLLEKSEEYERRKKKE